MENNIEELLHKQKLKYYKNWREKNKDKIKQHNKNFWLKKLEQEENLNGKQRNS